MTREVHEERRPGNDALPDVPDEDPEGASGRERVPVGRVVFLLVEVDGLPRSGQMVVADFRASMQKGKRPTRWMSGWRPLGFDLIEA